MVASTTCPNGRDFLRLMLGHIAGDDAVRMENHIRSCDLCQKMLKEVWVEETFIVKAEGTPTPEAVAASAAAVAPPTEVAAVPPDRPPSRPEVAPRPPSRADTSPRPPSRPDTSPRPPSRPDTSPRPPSQPEVVRRPPSRPEAPVRPPSKPEAVPVPAQIDEQAETRLAPMPAAIRATPRSASVLPAPPAPRPSTKPRPAPVEDVGQLTAKLLRPPRRPGELGWIGHFRVLEVLGSGSTALVVRAEEIEMHRAVALKILKPVEKDDVLSRPRFVREGKAAAGLEHDHIATVYQVAEDRGIPFLIMRLLQGETLAQRLKTQPTLPLDTLLRIGREMALGLAAAHEKGVLHCDLKPSNVWLDAEENRTKLLDFGTVKSAVEARSAHVVGTPAYMSPEQARGKEIDERSDLYGLGCVLYRMAAGRTPLAADDPTALMRAIQQEEPPLLLDFRPDAPPELADLVFRLLAKAPDDRPASAAAVAEALAKIAAEGGKPDLHGFLPARPWGVGFWGRWGLRSVLAATVLLAVYYFFFVRSPG